MLTSLRKVGMFGFVALLSVSTYAATEQEYRQKFIQNQLSKGYTRAEIDAFLQPAKKNALVLKTIRKPWEAQPWYKYYPIFITKKANSSGREVLAKVSKRHRTG